MIAVVLVLWEAIVVLLRSHALPLVLWAITVVLLSNLAKEQSQWVMTRVFSVYLLGGALVLSETRAAILLFLENIVVGNESCLDNSACQGAVGSMSCTPGGKWACGGDDYVGDESCHGQEA
jgi:hypothetical protein